MSIQWPEPQIVTAIYATYKVRRTADHREHLGASVIGRDCSRAIWYTFRWVEDQDIDGKTARLFDTGNREEARLIQDLRDCGYTIWDKDEETGKQFCFSEFGGHFKANLDGVGEGFQESKKLHLLEFKTANAKSFSDLIKKGLEDWKPQYYAQVQVGMHLSGLERCYFVVVCKDTDDIWATRVKLDKAYAMQLMAKARSIIFSDEPPIRISDDPAFYKCKMCEFAEQCHNSAPPKVSCRTCCHVSALEDGTWHCSKLDKVLSYSDQVKACEFHLFNPHISSWTVTDAEADWAEFATRDGEVIKNAGNSRQIKDEWGIEK